MEGPRGIRSRGQSPSSNSPIPQDQATGKAGTKKVSPRPGNEASHIVYSCSAKGAERTQSENP